jgi:hypothetical protein
MNHDFNLKRCQSDEPLHGDALREDEGSAEVSQVKIGRERVSAVSKSKNRTGEESQSPHTTKYNMRYAFMNPLLGRAWMKTRVVDVMCIACRKHLEAKRPSRTITDGGFHARCSAFDVIYDQIFRFQDLTNCLNTLPRE